MCCPVPASLPQGRSDGQVDLLISMVRGIRDSRVPVGHPTGLLGADRHLATVT
jgi:hypothetical protein